MYHRKILKISLFCLSISGGCLITFFHETDPTLRFFLILLIPYVLIWGIGTTLLQTYKIDNNGIAIVYAFQNKILKVIKFIPWNEVRYLCLNKVGWVVVVPNFTGNVLPGPNKVIMIRRDIINFHELLSQVIQNSKKAEIEEAVKLIV